MEAAVDAEQTVTDRERDRMCAFRLHLFTFRKKLKGNSALFKSGSYVDVPGV